MAHDKVFGFCENLCSVEVEPKGILYNENLLFGGDFACYPLNGETILNSMWTVENFTYSSSQGMMMLPPARNASIKQSVFPLWVDSPSYVEGFYPLTIAVNGWFGNNSNSFTFQKTIDSFKTSDVIGEISSGITIEYQILNDSNNDTKELKILVNGQIPQPVVIKRIKVEHGTQFTGWASSMKDAMIMRMIMALQS